MTGALRGALINIVDGIASLDAPYEVPPDDHDIKLAFPLTGYDKETILRGLLDDYGSKILYQGISCEHGRWCGGCISCNKMKSALMQLCTFKKYRNVARKALRDLFHLNVKIDYLDRNQEDTKEIPVIELEDEQEPKPIGTQEIFPETAKTVNDAIIPILGRLLEFLRDMDIEKCRNVLDKLERAKEIEKDSAVVTAEQGMLNREEDV